MSYVLIPAHTLTLHPKKVKLKRVRFVRIFGIYWNLTESGRHVFNTHHVRKCITNSLWPRKDRTESWKINKNSIKYQIFVTHQHRLKNSQNGSASAKTVLLHKNLGQYNHHYRVVPAPHYPNKDYLRTCRIYVHIWTPRTFLI